MENTLWLIWSIEHNAWWAPREKGYTQNRSGAGVYSYEKALEIVEGANKHTGDIPNEAMVIAYGTSPSQEHGPGIKITRGIKE